MREKISIGILGFGTVGSGTVRLLDENAELIRQRLGVPVEIKGIAVRDLKRSRAPGRTLPFTDNPGALIDDPQIDIIVELIGGYDPAHELVLAAIAAGKHVVTANKALRAEHGAEIRTAAERRGLQLGFEASVGGGIPIIKTIRESLAGNRIRSIYGIINGTSNYILTRMTEEHLPFNVALAEAQRAGYAEADPAFDVGGMDTAHKLAILVSLASGADVAIRDIYTEGITTLNPMDVDFGREFGFNVKLLAIAKIDADAIEARVHPTLVSADHAIAKVGGVYNAIQVVGDACEDIMLSGKGAGSMPTASAVVADIMDIGKHILLQPSPRTSQSAGSNHLPVRPMAEIRSIYYLRFMALDRPGVLSQISGILGRHNISIESMVQRGRKEGGSVPLVIMTHSALERDVQESLKEIRGLSCVTELPALIRVEGEDR